MRNLQFLQLQQALTSQAERLLGLLLSDGCLLHFEMVLWGGTCRQMLTERIRLNLLRPERLAGCCRSLVTRIRCGLDNCGVWEFLWGLRLALVLAPIATQAL